MILITINNNQLVRNPYNMEMRVLPETMTQTVHYSSNSQLLAICRLSM